VKNESRARKICDIDVPEGELYMPSNGTEGDMFMSHWCRVCANENGDGNDREVCWILTGALALGEQPPEWMYSKNGPCCTSWEKERAPEDKPSPGQLGLFEVA
jgi:hypothetical protein